MFVFHRLGNEFLKSTSMLRRVVIQYLETVAFLLCTNYTYIEIVELGDSGYRIQA